MIITCEQCFARFRLADEKIKPGGSRVRCSKCQNVFTVMPPPSAVSDDDTIAAGIISSEPAAEIPIAQPSAASEDAPHSRTDSTPAPIVGTVEFDFGFAETRSADQRVSESDIATEPRPDAPPLAHPTEPEPEDGGLAASTTEDEAGIMPAGVGPAREDGEDREDRDQQEITESSHPAVEDSPSGIGWEAAFTAETDLPAATGSSGAEGTDEDEDQFIFGDESDTSETSEESLFDQEQAQPTSSLEMAGLFDAEEDIAWDQADEEEEQPFDFDEPSFSAEEASTLTRSEEGGMGFGEISFDDRTTSGANVTSETPIAPDAALPPVQPAISRPPTPRPHMEDSPPTPAQARKGPVSRVLVLLILLLMVICGAGGYFILTGDGQKFIEQFTQKLKGEEPVAPAVQRIGLNITGSSYIENKDAGQLLVVQGTATNNFAGARSAITVKGLLLNADGKVLQQQTVFCGNYISEDQLREMKFSQVEEMMNNQFGDSLTNMNVKSGAIVRFTVVFRNPPQELATINVEVVDSKPGGV